MLCGLSVGCNFPQQRLQTEVESTLVRSPGLYINPDGDTGAFFRAENYRREFCVPKTEGLNVEVFALRVNFSEGTCQVKRGLWRNFMEEYGLKPVIRYVFINQCIQKVLVPYKKSNFVF